MSTVKKPKLLNRRKTSLDETGKLPTRRRGRTASKKKKNDLCKFINRIIVKCLIVICSIAVNRITVKNQLKFNPHRIQNKPPSRIET